MDGQVCNHCQQLKSFLEYHKQSSRSNGYRGTCKLCRKPEIAHNRIAGAERIRVTGREWRRRNKDVVNERVRAAKGADFNYVLNQRKSLSSWKKRNKAKVNAESGKRRATRLCATPAWSNFDAIQIIYTKSERVSIWLGLPHHVDHIVPLISDYVCGLHCESNLQIITAKDNLSKNNRWWPDMWEPTKE